MAARQSISNGILILPTSITDADAASFPNSSKSCVPSTTAEDAELPS